MADIGTTLREARMRARIDITEVESATKIRARYLRAIENEEWDALPGSVYVKSFLRTYGDYLGLDSRLLVEEYKRRYERPSDHEPRSVGAIHRERERAARGPLLPPWALIGLVLVAIVVVLFIVGELVGNKSPSNTQATKPPPTHHTTTTPHHHHRAAALPTTPKKVTLQLVPTGQVYVCLTNARGDKLIAGRIFSAGETIPTETAGTLLLTLGNNAVQMKVNGKTVPVAASAGAIGLKLTPTGMHSLPSSQQPTCA
jgi:cytoskeleton protein RodZ